MPFCLINFLQPVTKNMSTLRILLSPPEHPGAAHDTIYVEHNGRLMKSVSSPEPNRTSSSTMISRGGGAMTRQWKKREDQWKKREDQWKKREESDLANPSFKSTTAHYRRVFIHLPQKRESDLAKPAFSLSYDHYSTLIFHTRGPPARRRSQAGVRTTEQGADVATRHVCVLISSNVKVDNTRRYSCCNKPLAPNAVHGPRSWRESRPESVEVCVSALEKVRHSEKSEDQDVRAHVCASEREHRRTWKAENTCRPNSQIGTSHGVATT